MDTIIYCTKCRKDVVAKEPAFIKRGKGKRLSFSLIAHCNVCETKGSLMIRKELRKDWPGKDHDFDLQPEQSIAVAFTQEKAKEGGVFFIPPLVAAIIGGVTAAGAAAGGGAAIANTVLNNKRQQEALEEQRRRNDEELRIQRDAVAKLDAGMSGDGILNGHRSLKILKKTIKRGGSISEDEVKDMIKIFNGLGFTFIY